MDKQTLQSLIGIMERRQEDIKTMSLHARVLHRRIDLLTGIVSAMLQSSGGEEREEIAEKMESLISLDPAKMLNDAETPQISEQDQFDATLADLKEQLDALE